MRRLLILVALGSMAATFLQACEDRTGAEPEPTSGVLATPEFKSLSLAPLGPAVIRLQLLTIRPSATATRGELVDLYREAGYSGVSRFYENTQRESENRELLVSSQDSSGGWGGGEGELSEGANQSAQRVAALVAERRYRDAVVVAQREIEQSGPTLQLAAEWAHAVLSTKVESPDEVSPEAMEVALRILLTGAEDRFPLPIGMTSEASAYALVARAFVVAGDGVSARTAARLAIKELDSGEHPDWTSTARDTLDELVRHTLAMAE